MAKENLSNTKAIEFFLDLNRLLIKWPSLQDYFVQCTIFIEDEEGETNGLQINSKKKPGRKNSNRSRNKKSCYMLLCSSTSFNAEGFIKNI